MSDNSSKGRSGGIGFFGLLTIVFIVLKLIDKIDWPWIWVLSPLWIPIAIFIIVMVMIFVINIIVKTIISFIDNLNKKK